MVACGCSLRTDLLPADGGVESCVAPGRFIELGGGEPCSAALAARALRHSICSCESLVLTRGLFTTSGSGMPGPAPGKAVAAVGTDGELQVAGPVQISGALRTATGAAFGRSSAVFGSLHSGGPLGSNQFLTVGGDAFAAGDVLGRVDVNGTLHVPPGNFVAPSVTAASVVREAVMVDPPCECKAGPVLDIPGLVATHQRMNANASINLEPDAFAKGAGPAALELPCGSYYLSELHSPSAADFELKVTGRTALYVGGDVTLGGGLRAVLSPGAELDLIVAGNLSASGGVIGASNPAAVRIWLGGTSIKVTGGTSLSALLYAPSALLVSDFDLEAVGAIYVQAFSISGDLAVRFEPRVLSAGGSCGGMPQPPVP